MSDDIDQWATASDIDDLVQKMASRIETLRAEVERLRAVGRKVLADYDDSYGPYVHDAMEALRAALAEEKK
jgi:hypothetical protein